MTSARISAREQDRDKIGSSHPAPWSIEEKATCFVVRDRNGQALSRVYFKDQHGRRSVGTVFTRDEGGTLLPLWQELWRNDLNTNAVKQLVAMPTAGPR
jgi:hypothetical protein